MVRPEMVLSSFKANPPIPTCGPSIISSGPRENIRGLRDFDRNQATGVRAFARQSEKRRLRMLDNDKFPGRPVFHRLTTVEVSAFIMRTLSQETVSALANRPYAVWITRGALIAGPTASSSNFERTQSALSAAVDPHFLWRTRDEETKGSVDRW